MILKKKKPKYLSFDWNKFKRDTMNMTKKRYLVELWDYAMECEIVDRVQYKAFTRRYSYQPIEELVIMSEQYIINILKYKVDTDYWNERNTESNADNSFFDNLLINANSNKTNGERKKENL